MSCLPVLLGPIRALALRIRGTSSLGLNRNQDSYLTKRAGLENPGSSAEDKVPKSVCPGEWETHTVISRYGAIIHSSFSSDIKSLREKKPGDPSGHRI